MRFLKQSTSVDVPIGPFVDQTDGFTAETALTITQPDIRLKKNGGAWAQKNAAQTLSHEENGYYEVTLDATDTDTLGLLRLAVNESGALPVWEDFMVLPAAVYDALISGSGNGVRADVQVVASGALTASALATDAVNEIADGLMTRPSSNWEATVKSNPKCLGGAVMTSMHETRDQAGTLQIADSTGNFSGTNALSRSITTDAANQPIDQLGAVS